MRAGFAFIPIVLLFSAMVSVPASTAGQQRRSIGCSEHDLPCHLRAAAQAEQAGDLDFAEATYRHILRLDPDSEPAYAALIALTDGRTLSKESDSYNDARELLDRTFLEYETRRFIVLSNADPRWSRSQAEHLERAHHQFMRFVNRLGIRPLPLQHKLVCVLFEHQRDYQDFAATNDNIHDPWIAGYYSPRHDRVVFFRTVDGGRDVSDDVSIATTIHEAIHQLHFHTRVKSLYVQYPLWICEGLATAFETSEPGGAFGPDHEYAPRRDRFLDLLESGEMLPLSKLVVLTAMHDASQATVHAMYHQSYAFVVWLNRFRSDQLRAYLQSMLREPPGKVSADRQTELFEAAFGPVKAVEQQWLQHERRALATRTPPEHEPGDSALTSSTCRCSNGVLTPPVPNGRLAIGVAMAHTCDRSTLRFIMPGIAGHIENQ